MEIRVERLTEDNFNSLDNFIRHQDVTECWRNVDGNWILQPISFVENWGLDKCREEASAIANNLHGDMIDCLGKDNHSSKVRIEKNPDRRMTLSIERKTLDFYTDEENGVEVKNLLDLDFW